jgi:DNA repair exonuclease SbcCD nuclease subunit
MKQKVSNKKICLISDIHFGNKKGVVFMLNSMEQYFKKELIPYLVKNKIKKVFILGDFYDTRTTVDVRVSNVVFDVLKKFQESKIELTILLGNHDIFFNSSVNVHSLKYFDLFDNIKIVDRIITDDVYGRQCTFFPWQTDNLFQSCEYDSEIAFGHFAINGCQLNKTQVFEGGNPQTFFHNNFKKTFTGHFHQPGVYTQGDSEIVYIGSPYHLSRSDSNSDRGVIILDMEDLSWERVYSKSTLKYLAFGYGKDLSKVDIPGNIIDVHVNITSKFDSAALNKYVAEIENCLDGSPINVNVIPHYELDNSADVLTNDEIEKVKSIPEMVKSKLVSMDLSDGIKDKVTDYINNLMATIEQNSI